MREMPSLPILLATMLLLATGLQLAPLYWPGGGGVLAAAATLPVALGCALIPRRAPWLFVVNSLLIGLGSVHETYLFLTITGALGVLLGLLAEQPPKRAIPVSAAVLTGGMLLLPHLAGIYALAGVERYWPVWLLVPGYACCALIYATLWQIAFRRLWLRLRLRLHI